jgi:hypothetical protein
MPEYVYALHDFLPENEDEVSFHAGERIEVIEKDDMYGDGWWQVCDLALHLSRRLTTLDRAVILLVVLVYFLSATQRQHPQLQTLLTPYPLLNPFLSPSPMVLYQPAMANPSYSLLLKNPNSKLQALISCPLFQSTLQLLYLTVTTTLN